MLQGEFDVGIMIRMRCGDVDQFHVRIADQGLIGAVGLCETMFPGERSRPPAFPCRYGVAAYFAHLLECLGNFAGDMAGAQDAYSHGQED